MVRYATVVKKSVFDSAHKNSGFGEGHKCNRIHGHSFVYEVHVRSLINEETGLSVDFGVVKEAMKERVDKVLDHYFLNEDVEHFRTVPPSAENIACFIYEQVQEYLDKKYFVEGTLENHAEVLKVVLNETPTSTVIINKEDIQYTPVRFEGSE